MLSFSRDGLRFKHPASDFLKWSGSNTNLSDFLSRYC